MSEPKPLHIVVKPTPSDAEAAAIIAAVSHSLPVEFSHEPERSKRDPWREAAKREALRGGFWKTRS